MTSLSGTSRVYASVVKRESGAEAKQADSVGNAYTDNSESNRSYLLFNKERFSSYPGMLVKEEYAARPEEYRKALFSNPGSKYFVIDPEDPSFGAFIDYRMEQGYAFHPLKAFIEAVFSTPVSRYSIVDSEEPPFVKFIDDRCVEDQKYISRLLSLAQGRKKSPTPRSYI